MSLSTLKNTVKSFKFDASQNKNRSRESSHDLLSDRSSIAIQLILVSSDDPSSLVGIKALSIIPA